MTEIYLGGAVSSPSINYTERLKYLELARKVSRETGALFLDTVNDKKLYGMVDNQFYIVAPNPELVSFGDYAGDIVGLNYVTSQYNKFRDEYVKAVNTTALSAPDIVSGLIPKKSYVNFNVNFNSYQQLVEEILVDIIVRKYYNERNSYRDFLTLYKKAMFDEEMENYKLTKTGYVLSSFSSCFESGLYIDLSPGLSPEIDSVKASLLLDEDFQCYAQTATRHGFYVDLNCPWRLILNLNSKKTRLNIVNNNITRPFYGFYRSEYLERVGYGDFWVLQGSLGNCYKKFYEIVAPSGPPLSDNISPYVAGDLKSWIEIYLLTRFREIGIIKLEDFESTDNSDREASMRYMSALASCYQILDAADRTSSLSGFDFGPLTSRSGPIGYIEKLCAEELKTRLMKEQEYFTRSSQEFTYRQDEIDPEEYYFEQSDS